MKHAKFEEIVPARFDAEPPVDRDDIIAALVEQNRVHSVIIVRLMWAMLIVCGAVFIPMINEYLLPLLRG